MLLSLLMGLCVLGCNAQWSPGSARGDRSFDRPRSNMNAYGGRKGRPVFNGDRPRLNMNAYGRQNERPVFNGNSVGRQQFGDRMKMFNIYNGNGMGKRMWQRGDDFMGQGWDDSMSGSWSNEDWSGEWSGSWSGEDWSDGNPVQYPWQKGGDRMGQRMWPSDDDFMGKGWDDSMSGSWSNEDWSDDWSGEDWSDGNPVRYLGQNGGNRMGPRMWPSHDDFMEKGWDDSKSNYWFGSWSDEDSSDSDSSSSESGSDSRFEEFTELYGSWSGDDSSESDSSSSESGSDSSSEEWKDMLPRN